jgi:prepilin-type N-terminal cleavage/methylation domain-containing protein
MKRKNFIGKNRNAGFSLLECVIAIFIVAIGLLAVAALAAVATQGEIFAFNSTDASALAASKMEELKAGTLTEGGSLTSNVTGYSDTPSWYFYRRWEIKSGPSGTKEVTVVVVPQVSGNKVRTTQVKTLVR